MNIKILGSGCARCHELFRNTGEAVKELGSDATVEYVDDIKQIIKYNVISTPGLVIDDKVISTGKSLSKRDLVQIIQKAKTGS